MRKKLELLAPAGSPEKMQYAFAYGADAVYMGIPDFSLRVRINKFGLDDVKTAIELAHKLKKKIYVTVNIYAHNRHLEKLPEYLKKLNEWRPDGLLVSDPGILQMVKKYAPKLEIHLSTQANATNWQAVKFWYEQGVKRVVLGREVTIEEIKEIHKKVPKVELEYFVHGAMCMSYSGRCMLSAWLTGRSANQGDCAQPCRWKYKVEGLQGFVEEPQRPGQKIPVEEDQNGTYIFNSKDLCLLEYLQELVDVGVVSFKIEGRAKSVAYLSTVVKAYRLALDVILSKAEGSHGKQRDSSNPPPVGGFAQNDVKKELRKLKKKYLDSLMTRGYTTGFLFGREKVEQNTAFSHIGGEEKFVGEVVDCIRLQTTDYRLPSNKIKTGNLFKIVFKPHNALKVGEKIKIMVPEREDFVLTLKKLYNKQGKEVESLHGGTDEKFYFESKVLIPKYSILFKK